MSNKFVEEILKITETKDATILSHYSMEILANLVSDGRDAWLIPNPSYDVVCSKLENTLDQWDVNIEFNLSYNGFEGNFFPLLDSSQCQRFALWTLASATRQTNSMYLFFSLKFFNFFERVMQNCLPNSRYENGMQYFLFFPACF